MLVGPVTVFYGGKKFMHAVQPALKVFVCLRVWLGHIFKFRAVRFKNADVLYRRFWIHYADEAQSEVRTYLRQADTHIPATRLNNNGIGSYNLGFDGLRDNVVRCPILYTSARIQTLELRINAKRGVCYSFSQPNQRSVANHGYDTVPYG